MSTEASASRHTDMKVGVAAQTSEDMMAFTKYGFAKKEEDAFYNDALASMPDAAHSRR